MNCIKIREIQKNEAIKLIKIFKKYDKIKEKNKQVKYFLQKRIPQDNEVNNNKSILEQFIY